MHALGDSTRCRVFEQLRDGPKSVRTLAERRPVSRPAVSQHLKVLKNAGLVQERPEGTRRIYSIRTDGLEELRSWLNEFWDDALAAYKKEVEKE